MTQKTALNPPCPSPPLVLPRGVGGDRHLLNPEISLRVSVLSCGSVCCEALRLVSPILWQDILNRFLGDGT